MKSSANGWAARFEPFAMFVACVLLFWAGNDQTNLWDRDEPRYAETARRMLRSGDYVVPYFNDAFRFQKPPFTYWLIAAAYRLLGDNEFAARAGMGVAAAAASLLIWRLGDRMFRPPAGKIAGWMLALCPITLFLGKLALPDGPQLLGASACMLCLYAVWRPTTARAASSFVTNEELPSSFHALAFWVSLAATLLIKGPIVLAMIVLALTLLKIFTGSGPADFHLRWKVGGPLLLALMIPWSASIFYTTGTSFFAEALGNQIGKRMVESFDNGFQPPFYYALSVFIGFAPWTGYALLAVVRQFSARRAPGPIAFLMAWFFGFMLLLECFRTKQPHYFAPAYPALALLAASHLSQLLRGEVALRWDFVWRWAVCLAGFLGAVLAVLLVVLGAVTPPSARAGAWAGAAVVGVAALLAVRLLRRDRLAAALRVQAGAQIALFLCLGLGFLPGMNQARIARRIGERLALEQLHSPRAVFCFHTWEPSMIYYSGLPLIDYWELGHHMTAVKNGDQDVICITSPDDLERLHERLPGRCVVECTWRGWLRMHEETAHLVRIHASPQILAARESAPIR